MRFNEFRPDETTPETTSLVWFVIHESNTARVIKKKFGKVIKECGGALSVPGKYWSLIQNLAYTSGGEVEQVPMPKKCAKVIKMNTKRMPATIDTAQKKIKFESREHQREFIMFINGRVPTKTWVQMMYEHETSSRMLTESVNQETFSTVSNLISFSTDKVEVGQSYIPVPLFVVGNDVQLWDIQGGYPAKCSAEWCELLDATDEELVFDVKGRPITYPYSELKDRMVMTVIVCASADDYNQLRAMAILQGLDKLPSLTGTVDEAEEGNLNQTSNVLTPQFDLETDKINDAGAGVQAHTQIDNYVQSASATQKPIKPVPMP